MPALMDTYLKNRSRVQPNHANNHQTAHGGNVMKWLDEVGAMAAMRFAGETCVTARMEGIDFERPVPVGDTVLIEAYVYDAGRTSANVHLEAFRENPRTGETERTSRSHATFVALDDEKRPTEVPELTVESDRGRELRDAALEMRD